MTSKRGQANATAFAEMCQMLNHAACTRADICERTGLSPRTATLWVQLLRRRHLIFIAKYDRKTHATGGAWAEVFRWGYREPDAERPKPLTQAESARNKRVRKRAQQRKSNYEHLEVTQCAS
jgi:hypothetical protein